MLTEGQLSQIFPLAGQRVGTFRAALNEALPRWQIDHPRRIAAFLAQIGHESGQLRYVKEAGDGSKYRGRGLIQITGRNSYQACSRALFGDERLLAQPQLLEQPRWACESAAWFWHSRGLNALADRGEFNRITRLINGGLNGLDDRLALWARAREVLC